jgi:hypothetical protein
VPKDLSMVSFEVLAVIFINIVNVISFIMEKQTGSCHSETQLLNSI